MPRGRAGKHNRRAAFEIMRLEQLRHDTHERRRAARARQRQDSLRQTLSGWTELCDQTEVLDIQIEMQAMELRLVNEDRRLIGLSPISILPPDGSLGDMRRPEDDHRNYR